MQLLGRYVLSADASGDVAAPAMAAEIELTIAAWLDPKGDVVEAGPPIAIAYKDGRRAELSVSKLDAAPFFLMTWRLDEPIDQGRFRTFIELAANGTRISLDVQMEAGTDGILAPLRVDARCPTIVRRLLENGWRWEVGGWLLPHGLLQYRGIDGGREFLELLGEPSRTLPVVVVSEDESWPADFIDAIRADVAGVAVVASVDAGAAWEITNRFGRHWSCYNGALRVYWPRWRVDQEPLNHPLWTKDRISRLRPSEELAYRALRNAVRRRLLRLSTLGMQRDSLFGDALNAYRKRQRSRAKDTGELLDIALDENADLVNRIEVLEQENARLRVDLENSELMRVWEEPDEAGELEPDSVDVKPGTVTDAVDIARAQYGDQILFGDVVDEAVGGLAADAGPPEKVLRFLEGLSDLASTLQEGPLGKDVIGWLKERGYPASGESQTIKNRGGRSWPVEGVAEDFEQHLKPNESTSPDRCVRIYFKWDDSRGKVVVGWVGRHPD
jgi:hypothetical protein